MKYKKQIGWQKYEDVLEGQMVSPLTQMLIKKLMQEDDDDDDDYGDDEKYKGPDSETQSSVPFIQLSDDLASEFSMAASFDCWVGHTNFDITPTVRKILDSVEGVEILKICSRYRFFIGVGKMFTFKNVRKELENQILKKEQEI